MPGLLAGLALQLFSCGNTYRQRAIFRSVGVLADHRVGEQQAAPVGGRVAHVDFEDLSCYCSGALSGAGSS